VKAVSAFILMAQAVIYRTARPLKVRAKCTSYTSGSTRSTTQRHIPEDPDHQQQRCENLKCDKVLS